MAWYPEQHCSYIPKDTGVVVGYMKKPENIMIGGTDIVIRAPDDPESLDICARITRLFWPKAVFEDAVTGDSWLEYAQISFGQIRELMVYPSVKDKEAWDAGEGQDRNSMIQFLLGADGVTVVMDDPGVSPMPEIIDGVRNFLRGFLERQ